MLFNLFKVGVVFACLSVVPRAAVGADAADPWTAFRFLLGEWEGEGTGQPGKGSDGFLFAFDLDRKILVRKNRNDIPATATHPATAHQDLMVIYREEPAKPTRAIYFDNAGHVIR